MARTTEEEEEKKKKSSPLGKLDGEVSYLQNQNTIYERGT